MKKVKIHWQCECGNHEEHKPEDKQVSVGNASFRLPGCSRCYRPIRLVGKDEQEELVGV